MAEQRDKREDFKPSKEHIERKDNFRKPWEWCKIACRTYSIETGTDIAEAGKGRAEVREDAEAINGYEQSGDNEYHRICG